jgi:hypothetical protein
VLAKEAERTMRLARFAELLTTFARNQNGGRGEGGGGGLCAAAGAGRLLPVGWSGAVRPAGPLIKSLGTVHGQTQRWWRAGPATLFAELRECLYRTGHQRRHPAPRRSYAVAWMKADNEHRHAGSRR